MRIGILTLPLHSNYGGIMQAWALQTVLMRMGHKVKVIDKNLLPPKANWLYIYPKRIFLKYILHKNIPVFHEKLMYENYSMRTKYILPFIEKYIARKIIYDVSEIKKDEFDVIIFGSDQIWRPKYYCQFYKRIIDAFGAFAYKWNINLISYAASFGLDNLNEFNKKEIIKIKECIQKFNGVSVRESQAIYLCKNFFNVNAIHVLDPTLLLNKGDYISLISPDIVQRNGIMQYILDLDTEKQKIVKSICQCMKMPLFSCIHYSETCQPAVEQWLAGFRDASIIITDSFHACVFSIIFHKPFIVIENPQRGLSRIKSLLGIFNLQHHLITNINQIKPLEYYKLNEDVYKILSDWQIKSFKFLNSSLVLK